MKGREFLKNRTLGVIKGFGLFHPIDKIEDYDLDAGHLGDIDPIYARNPFLRSSCRVLGGI